MTCAWKISPNGLLLSLSLILSSSGCATGGEPGSVARAWEGSNARAKVMFVVGFNNGWKMGVISSSVASEEPSDETKQLFARFDGVGPDKLVVLLDDFYADPANQFVTLDFAMDLVIDKAAGVDIERSLGKAREIGMKSSRGASNAAR